MTQYIHCPHCRKPVAWKSESRWRPFCSERCKMIDLGGWMSEEHRIPGVELPDDMLDEVREHFDPANDEHR
ncbi:DNA gyrase inhibitor YacG [Natronocella acetinitrilica]|nr:DNA gyrase inhibitor YacG [Natronocella acetinitrilica]